MLKNNAAGRSGAGQGGVVVIPRPAPHDRPKWIGPGLVIANRVRIDIPRHSRYTGNCEVWNILHM